MSRLVIANVTVVGTVALVILGYFRNPSREEMSRDYRVVISTMLCSFFA